MPPGSNLVDFNGAFSYIISSWLAEEGQKSTDIASYISVFSGGLLQHFVGIAISTCFGGDC